MGGLWTKGHRHQTKGERDLSEEEKLCRVCLKAAVHPDKTLSTMHLWKSCWGHAKLPQPSWTLMLTAVPCNPPADTQQDVY